MLVGAAGMVLFCSQPLYGRLVFGPEARVSVWLIVDGERTYLDRSGSDTPRKRERVDGLSQIEIADPNGQTRYRIRAANGFHVQRGSNREAHLEKVCVDIQGPIAYRQRCDVPLSDDPKTVAAPHFHGPLTLMPLAGAPKPVAVIGGPLLSLPVSVGTASPSGDWRVVVCGRLGHFGIPDLPRNVFPTVEIDFPAKPPVASTLKRRFMLSQFD
jgi:hypothetical protein